jgi:predicted O-linked N-acetylglucosamine transferase (SPINDLY family)
MSDSELADTINRDEIDILVDLTGHAGRLRLGVFAQQPSPVQVTWLGYLSTVGLTRIRYRLSDARSDPPGLTEHLHTETLVRLPHSQWCYRPWVPIDHATEPPFRRNGFITFGSFNNMPKLSRTVLKLWFEILARLPDSRLVIVGVPEGHARERLHREFGEAGVDASRITIVPRIPLDQYFRWFDAVDIALDTMPYSGGTTTCDTLWMGVPVVTCPGSRSVSRSAASILATVGLPAWIASTPEDYVRLAVEFARDGAAIAELRKSLRQRMRESPIMDEPRFVSDVEDAYRQMWRTWCGDAS